MVLTLRYGDLASAIGMSKSLVHEFEQYSTELTKKVQSKIHEVEGGMSGNLISADYYVNEKIKKINTRRDNVIALGDKLQSLKEKAERVDKGVARKIVSAQKVLFEQNSHLKPSYFKLGLNAFWAGLKKVPILGWILKRGEESITSASDAIKQWWRFGGGMELVTNLVDIAVKIGFAVAAVVTAVTAIIALFTATVITGGAILFASAAFVAAVISIFNAVTNTKMSICAIAASNNGDSAMAKRYSEINTYSDYLRVKNDHDRNKNRASMRNAKLMDITDAVCGVVMIVQNLGKAANAIFKKHGISFAFKELARGTDGKLTTKVTLNSIWRGTKALVLNKSLTKSTSTGLRTTLINSIKESARYQAALGKAALKDVFGWMKKKDKADLGFFKNITRDISKNWASLTKGEPNDKMKVIQDAIKRSNDELGKAKRVLDRFDHDDGKGNIRLLTERLVKDALFDNDYTKIINKTGIGKIILDFDKSGTLKDYTGFDNGLWQKLESIKKLIITPPQKFEIQYPYLECKR